MVILALLLAASYAPTAADQVQVSTGKSAARWQQMPDCAVGTNALGYADGGFECGAVSGGGGGGGAPTNATYITQTPNATLTNEQALSALGTGIVKNTTGTGVLSIATSGTDYAPATSGSTVLLGNGTGGFSSYAGTSCTNQFPRSLSTAGAATCASVSLSADTTGTLSVGKGGSGLTTVAADQVYLGTAADTFTAKSLPSCSNATTSKLLYDTATHAFSCGTDQTGGGGGTSPLILSFGGF